jgi:hypothetical protein
MPTISTLPVYPIPNRDARVIFTLTESGSNFVRVWVTVAPEGSKLASELKESTQNRFVVYAGDGGETQPWRLNADKGGRYTLVAQEYTKGSGFGGGYEGDPLGAPTEVKVGTEATLTLEIGQKFTQRIGAGGDIATIVLWVWSDTIRKTTVALHAEDSPRIESDAPTPLAKTAMETSSVVAGLADLADVACTTALGTLSTIVSEMVSDINAHIGLGAGVHDTSDTHNAIPRELAAAPTPQTMIEFVNDALLKMRRHRLNDHGGDASAGTPPGTGSSAYHEVGGVPRGDLANMPLFQSVGSQEEAYAALADIWRAHEGHRVSLVVHGTADNTYALAALPKLLELHRRFLAVLASLTPSAPPAQSSGAQLLISVAGFQAG